jgi:hypothetical protein
VTNNCKRIIEVIVLFAIYILLLTTTGKAKSNSFEIDRKDYEYLLDRAKKWESVRTNAPVIIQTNNKIYMSIANLLQYEINVQRANPVYPDIALSGGVGLTYTYPYIRIPLEVGLCLRQNISAYFRADAVGFFYTNFNLEVGVKLNYP